MVRYELSTRYQEVVARTILASFDYIWPHIRDCVMKYCGLLIFVGAFFCYAAGMLQAADGLTNSDGKQPAAHNTLRPQAAVTTERAATANKSKSADTASTDKQKPGDAAEKENRTTTETAASATSDGNSTASDPITEYRQALTQWQAALVDVADVQAQLGATPPPQRGPLMPQYSFFVTKANSLQNALQAAAEKAYAVDDKNSELADLLYNMAIGNLRSDRYQDALRLAKLLIDHHDSHPGLYRMAATAAFATMQLDEAKKYLEALGGGKIPADSDLQTLASEIEYSRPLWQREQKLREAEAKADDLPRVKLHTTRGDIVLELFENEAPNTVANFISLVEKGLYDGTQFHRVLPGFMAQGGDPLSKDPEKNVGHIGTGGPGYTIADECKLPDHRDHFIGTLSMAHTAAPDTGGSQFFITFAPTPQLNSVHTVFGRVIEGQDVLDSLQRINPDWEKEHPSSVQPDRILKAEVVRKRDHPYEPKTIELKAAAEAPR
jgi:cyclophilin family peptidyl-prolyl cis-trans isomerase